MRKIAKKTILCFSKAILEQFPGMAVDAAGAARGEAAAWIRTSGRVVSSVCEVYKACAQRKNEKVLAGAVEDEEKLEDRQVASHIRNCLSEEERFFADIQKKISAEYARFETEIASIPSPVWDVSEQKKKVDRDISEETAKKKAILKKREMAEREEKAAKMEKDFDTLNRMIGLNRKQTQVLEMVRQYLKEAIDRCDQDMKKSSIANELTSKEAAQLTECYHLLQRQYQKQFVI